MVKAKVLIILCGTILAQLFGGWDVLLKTLVYLAVIDYITGFLAGAYLGRLSSNIGFKGIIKKVAMFSIVLVSCIVSEGFQTEIVRNATIIFYISNEGLSVLENVTKIDVVIPDKLRKFLEAITKEDNNKEV